MRTINNANGDYEGLASAIIESALNDYVSAMTNLLHWKTELDKFKDENYIYTQGKYAHSKVYCDSKVQEYTKVVEECKRFFYSKWMKQLSDVNVEILLDNCNKRIQEKVGKEKWESH